MWAEFAHPNFQSVVLSVLAPCLVEHSALVVLAVTTYEPIQYPHQGRYQDRLPLVRTSEPVQGIGHRNKISYLVIL